MKPHPRSDNIANMTFLVLSVCVCICLSVYLFVCLDVC